MQHVVSQIDKNRSYLGSRLCYTTGCGKKSSPLQFFAVFSATAWNFNMEFYKFIYRGVLHLTAKRNMILLKNDEIIDF